ncbi:MAG: tol-pal system-associated acyl-CoA thioesterase [Kordiimonas sp.]|nr:tol-pal system-associated acyl-CoA thioesterase [Kordiimonas sp.]
MTTDSAGEPADTLGHNSGSPSHRLDGLIDGLCHVLPLRVYYEDTDAGQVVYYANYLKFMERGRSNFLRCVGVDQREMLSRRGQDDVLFVVRRVDIEYLASAEIEDELEVRTQLREMGGAKLVMRQTVKKGPQTLTKAEVVVVSVKAQGRPARIPDHIRKKLQPYVMADGAAANEKG